MSTLARKPTALTTGWYAAKDCSLGDFREVVEQTTRLADYPHADAVVENVVVYGPRLFDHIGDPGRRRVVQAELAAALLDGPGIVVFKHAFEPAVVDAATGAFDRLITEQKAAGAVVGDHFAKPGANDRVWGALDKLAVADPKAFVTYYANDVLAVVSEAWLGPNYQVTSQVNVVNPGGQAQVAHRDYHLGFMDRAQAQAYPAQVHALSPALTLQGAVAHVDMPVETGPTMYLPYSQKYGPGYVAYHDPAFTEYFDGHFVQLPLEKGDAVFFNPALFHGAGTNRTTDVRRMANLLQVSSAFGRAMETVDTTAICEAIYPELLRSKAEGVDSLRLGNVVTAAAEGYPFPTNLDLDRPVGSLAPQSQAELLQQALDEGWAPARLTEALAAQQGRRRSQAG
ncbi:MAG TPA: phytanoyl-CoA dioxygenase family protein [Intrasporangium sp.]|uniref:phytanoyl-CoA dioxygenase family protein n=1 Tax=Intrasporangium sp. TaxID=1925024 RepID=UPI002D779FB6|nr:phytanoyl-CoA dioxygenase family protein [Intrasporangium sp.]HET7397338.1 phytanoyl-CoA dioxygenase family protein [Intrasporangium sp.]